MADADLDAELLARLDALNPEAGRRALQHLNASFQDQNDGNENVQPPPAQPAAAAPVVQQPVTIEMPSRPPHRKLRLFSGKTPVTSGESDFETWRMLATHILEDTHITEENKKITIIQSLLRPALDTVNTVRDSITSNACVQLLERIYGKIKDGHELVIDFHTTYQDTKELPSDYLNRLYLLLTEAADKNGLRIADIPHYLVRQFVRGCHDEELLTKLNLAEDPDNVLTFPDLLSKVRKEECRRTEKKLRLKHTAYVKSATVKDTPDNDTKIKTLESQVKHLTEALETMHNKHTSANTFAATASTASPHTQDSRTGNTHSGSTARTRRPVFCYKCGTDGHKMYKCRKDANPELVQKKLMSRPSTPLNDQ